MDEELRLADLLAALSVATDLGMGQPMGKAVRTCVLAVGLARAMDLPEREVRDVYHASLLRHLGCTATASLEARLYGGDELTSRPAAEAADFGDTREMLRLVLGTGRGAGLRRPGLVLGAALGDMRHGATVLRSVCDAGQLLAGRLRLGGTVADSIGQVFERWDGTGAPHGLAGDDITLAARVGEVATQAVLFHRRGGADAATAMVRRRAGGWFDPEVAAAFDRHGPRLLSELDAVDAWEAVLDAEPAPVRRVDRVELEALARTFGDMADLKSPHTLGHARGVADLAASAAAGLGLGDRDVEQLRLAALLHDLGRIGVSSSVWDSREALTRAQWELVRLHPYRTERILACSRVLEPVGRVAGLHHERLDGTGYHHGLTAPAIPMTARVLAAADVFQAATEGRPHRPARSPDEAATIVADEAAAGRLDHEAARAVVAAAGGGSSPVRPSWPGGLTDREVDVIRLVARGFTNQQVADELVISRRTAEHHVQHIYGKIGRSTRAAAAVFALEHGLLSG